MRILAMVKDLSLAFNQVNYNANIAFKVTVNISWLFRVRPFHRLVFIRFHQSGVRQLTELKLGLVMSCHWRAVSI